MTLPERWLKNAFVELHKVFLTFECTMLVSALIGLIEEDTGLLYFINAEHPWITLYADNTCKFIEKEIYFTKLGSPVDSNKVFVNLYQMKKNDIILIGSDGRDDFAVTDNSTGQIINQDEKQFLKAVMEANGNLSEIYRITSLKGIIMDDYSLIRIQYLAENRDFTHLKTISIAKYQSQDMQEALSHGLEYISKNPSDTEFLFFLGNFYKTNNDFKRAIYYFERVRLRNPFYLKNLIELAESHYANGNAERAKNILRECQKIDATNPKIVFLMEQLQIKIE
jgi:tetratricopeptide (TPR) repeat protein